MTQVDCIYDKYFHRASLCHESDGNMTGPEGCESEQMVTKLAFQQIKTVHERQAKLLIPIYGRDSHSSS